VAVGAGTAPLGLPGAEAAIALRYRRRVGGLFVGARLAFARSSHVVAAGYDLDRASLVAEAGPRWIPMRRLALSLGVAAGAGMLVRHGDGGNASGDLLAPLVGAGAGAEVRLTGTIGVYVDARYAVQWIRIDGARRASGDPAAEVGVAIGF
jgi:hypothetical protein